jgi:hypothetical protein
MVTSSSTRRSRCGRVRVRARWESGALSGEGDEAAWWLRSLEGGCRACIVGAGDECGAASARRGEAAFALPPRLLLAGVFAWSEPKSSDAAETCPRERPSRLESPLDERVGGVGCAAPRAEPGGGGAGGGAWAWATGEGMPLGRVAACAPARICGGAEPLDRGPTERGSRATSGGGIGSEEGRDAGGADRCEDGGGSGGGAGGGPDGAATGEAKVAVCLSAAEMRRGGGGGGAPERCTGCTPGGGALGTGGGRLATCGGALAWVAGGAL